MICIFCLFVYRMDINCMEVALSLLPATALGYLTFRATSHPTSRIRRKMPNLKVKRVQLFPVLRVHAFGRNIHLHHWFGFSVLLVSTAFGNMGFLETSIARGLLLGGIIQGLTMPKGHKRVISCKCSHCMPN